MVPFECLQRAYRSFPPFLGEVIDFLYAVGGLFSCQKVVQILLEERVVSFNKGWEFLYHFNYCRGAIIDDSFTLFRRADYLKVGAEVVVEFQKVLKIMVSGPKAKFLVWC